MRGYPRILIVVLLVWAGASVRLAAAVSVQLPGPVSSTTSAPTTRPESRELTTRANEALARGLKSLRAAPTSASAALQAKDLYSVGPAARAKLLEVVAEKSLPEHTFAGIVETFEFERDRSILPVLIPMYRATDSARDRYLTERFKAFDQQDSMLEVMVNAIENPPGGAPSAVSLRLLAEVVDTPAERMQASKSLIRLLQSKPHAGVASDILQTLQRITFQDFVQQQSWQQWYDRLVQEHPDGFTERDLYGSAIAERDQRFVREVKKNVNAAIVAKQVPKDYFDVGRYPEPEVRRYAARQCRELRDADLEVVKSAIKVLVEALKDEKDFETLGVMIESLGELAQAKPEMKPEVAPVLVARLTDTSATVVTAALKALAQVGSEKDCEAIEAVFRSPVGNELEAVGVRAQVVTSLYRLNCGLGTIIAALSDPSPDVRSNAARVLQYGRQASAAAALARALRAEQKADPQLAMVRALVALQSTADDALGALLEVAAKPGAAREPAVRGLIQAVGAVDLAPARAAEVVAAVGAALPVVATSTEARASLVADLQAIKRPIVGDIVARWLDLEASVETSRELAELLTKLASATPEVLETRAAALVAANRPAPAVVLLRAVIEFLSGASASPSQRARLPECRTLLARALFSDRTPESLKQAHEIVSAELAAKPQDGRLLVLRAGIREVLNRRREAAADLRLALSSDGAVMTPDERRDVERRLALNLIEAGDAAAARTFVEGLPARATDRDLSFLLARAEVATGKVQDGVAHMRQALDLPGKVELPIIRQRLAEALLRSPHATDRARARSLAVELRQEKALPENDLGALDTLILEDDRMRALARSLDDIGGDGVQEKVNEVVRAGPSLAPWLVDGLVGVARMGPAGAAERRILALRGILKDDPALRSVTIPEVGSPRESWAECAERLVNAWTSRGW